MQLRRNKEVHIHSNPCGLTFLALSETREVELQNIATMLLARLPIALTSCTTSRPPASTLLQQRRHPRRLVCGHQAHPHGAAFSAHGQRIESKLGAAGPRAAISGDDEAGLEDEEGEMEEILQELSKACHVIVKDDFLPEARQLRQIFDRRFADPRSISPERFMWDYWHVPDQYTLVRTQAQVYFPADLYDRLEDALISYGESVLGCRAITPIWMSYYVEGCLQELHCDNPHGPFAFVLSLTEWDTRRFRGGETMILRPEVLDYWGSLYNGRQGLEHGNLLQLVEPRFNRLTVFNPSFPHGVKQVTGTRDPREARLVLHGWFTQPTPFFTGGLAAAEAVPVLNEVMEEMMQVLADLPAARGILTVRLHVSGSDGSVLQLEWVADTLVPLPAGPDLPADQVRAGIQAVVQDMWLEQAQFPASENGSDSFITLPIVFE